MSLIESVRDNDLQQVKTLIARGADVNAVDQEGGTALFWASEKNHIEYATTLIDAKADVDKADNNGVAPLHRASIYGRVECVRVGRFCVVGV
jgi:ankyrin repeat protein